MDNDQVNIQNSFKERTTFKLLKHKYNLNKYFSTSYTYFRIVYCIGLPLN